MFSGHRKLVTQIQALSMQMEIEPKYLADYFSSTGDIIWINKTISKQLTYTEDSHHLLAVIFQKTELPSELSLEPGIRTATLSLYHC